MAVTISGLKYTTGLSMAGLDDIGPPSLNRLCRLLARQRINLPFLISSHASQNSHSACFCFDKACFRQAGAVISGHLEDTPGGTAVLHSDVAAVTLFPRGRGLGLAMGVPAALIAAGVHPLGAGSSLGATVTVVKGADLARALEILLGAFPLPAGLKPTGERIIVVQEPRR